MARTTFRARHKVKIGSSRLHYFRNYAMSASRAGMGAGFRSHGVRIGRLTLNFTLRRWTFDTPGRGSVSGSFPVWMGGSNPSR